MTFRVRIALAGIVASGMACGSSRTPESAPDSGPGSSDAGITVGAADPHGLERVNHWRALTGLPALAREPKLEASSLAHARFMASNPDTCWPGSHNEVDSGCRGFTGAGPGDRVTAAGYQWGQVGEAIISDETDANLAVDIWLWAAFHRFIVLGSNTSAGGYSSADGHCVLDIAAPLGSSPTPLPAPYVFPYADMVDVPTSWNGLESPAPPAPSTGWPSGPVISVHFPAINWDVTAVTLSRTGSRAPTLPTTLVTPANNATLKMLSNDAAIFYADQPLASGVNYTVKVDGTLGGGPWTKTWAFTTH